jgi:hypothetical protein
LQALIVDGPPETLHTLQGQGFTDGSFRLVVDLFAATEHLRRTGKDLAFLGLRISQLLQLIHPGSIGGHGDDQTTEYQQISFHFYRPLPTERIRQVSRRA